MKITLDANDLAKIVFDYFADKHYNFLCEATVDDNVTVSVTLIPRNEDEDDEYISQPQREAAQQLVEASQPVDEVATPLVQQQAPVALPEAPEARKSDINPIAKRNLFGTKATIINKDTVLEETRLPPTSSVTANNPFAGSGDEDVVEADDSSEDQVEEADEAEAESVEESEESVPVIQETVTENPPKEKPKSIFSFGKPKA